eukprot:gene18608-25122_t
MTKTLHLYEPHFVDMLEEALKEGSQKMIATAVLEPYVGQSGGKEGVLSPGDFVGGDNFLISNGCLVKVTPYMRASVFPMADMPVAEDDMVHLRDMVSELESIMRDVQNLSSKYRCQETASIQQAMFWIHQRPLAPSVMIMPSVESIPTAAAEAGDSGGEMEESDEQLVERAARLSWAALQWLPESSDEEKLLITQGRLLAMETQNLRCRLDLVINTMKVACASLAAKCALKTVQP